MEKDITKEAIQQSVYEIKGNMNLLRDDLRNYFNKIIFVLVLMLITLVLKWLL